MACFKYFQFTGQENRISVKVRGEAEGELLISTERKGEPVASIHISMSKEWHTYRSELASLFGKRALYFEYKGEEAIDFVNLK